MKKKKKKLYLEPFHSFYYFKTSFADVQHCFNVLFNMLKTVLNHIIWPFSHHILSSYDPAVELLRIDINLMTYMTIVEPDQFAHPCSLIREYAAR